VPATETSLEQRLAERTLALVNVASASREEARLAGLVAEWMPWQPRWRDGETLWFDASVGGRPLVVLAGHLDTVPAQDNLPGRIAGAAVWGLGASDMKGGLAVMIELAWWLADRRAETALDLGFVFFPREEVALEESPLPRLFETGLLDRAALVIVLEPTDNTIQAGCLGGVTARLTFTGVSCHSARPWLGVNAIDVAVEGLRPLVGFEPRPVEVGGLRFVEVLSVTEIEGGIAANVVPDRVTCSINYRYAPGRAPADAEAELKQLVGETGALEILTNAPPAHVAIDGPLVRRLREAGGLTVEPKQAWTPVAQFAERGLDAINLGPGATRYAHHREEQVESAELVRTFEALRNLVAES
jgi:succinyl-diaminopimelate desuccinylase